jgi:hypothetical protein
MLFHLSALSFVVVLAFRESPIRLAPLNSLTNPIFPNSLKSTPLSLLAR